nr:TauD/TfdA family dioxygenase [Actinoplanes sp. ATCC 53533]
MPAAAHHLDELSYAHRWPKRLVFFCEITAESRGATPVLDGELWLESLDAELSARPRELAEIAARVTAEESLVETLE